MSRATIVVVTNQKGGVGKTTSAVHLAFSLTQAGKSVCFVDMDTQGNGSSILSRDARINTKSGGAEKIFEGRPDLRGNSTPSGIDLLHGHLGLEKLDKQIITSETIPLRESVRNMEYDYVVFDTPPALGVRHLAPILWAHKALLPTKPLPMDVQGLTSTIRVINRLIETKQNAELKWKIVINMLDNRSKQQNSLAEKVRAQFPDNFVPFTFGQRVGVADCLTVGLPIWKFGGTPREREIASLWEALPSALGLL